MAEVIGQPFQPIDRICDICGDPFVIDDDFQDGCLGCQDADEYEGKVRAMWVGFVLGSVLSFLVFAFARFMGAV